MSGVIHQLILNYMYGTCIHGMNYFKHPFFLSTVFVGDKAAPPILGGKKKMVKKKKKTTGGKN